MNYCWTNYYRTNRKNDKLPDQSQEMLRRRHRDVLSNTSPCPRQAFGTRLEPAEALRNAFPTAELSLTTAPPFGLGSLQS